MGNFSIGKVKRCIHHYAFVLPERYSQARKLIFSVVTLTMAYLARNILNSKGRLDKSVYLGFAGLCFSLFYLFCARVEKQAFNKHLNKLTNYERKIAIAKRRYGSNSLKLAVKYSETLDHLHEPKNYAKGKLYAEKSLEMITSLGFVDDCGVDVYYNLSSFYFVQQRLYKALEYAKMGLDLRSSESNDSHDKKLWDHFLKICREINRLENSFKKSEEGLKKNDLQDGEENTLKASRYYFMSGALIKYKEGNLDEAIEFFEKSLKIRENILGDDNVLVANCYRILGMCYMRQKDFTKVKTYLEKALLVFKQCSDNWGIYWACFNLGRYYFKKQNRDINSSIKYFKKALDGYDDVFGLNDANKKKIFVYLIKLYALNCNGEEMFKYIDAVVEKIKHIPADRNLCFQIMQDCTYFFNHLLSKRCEFSNDEICKYGEKFVSMYEQQKLDLKAACCKNEERKRFYNNLCSDVVHVYVVLAKKKFWSVDFNKAVSCYQNSLNIIDVENLNQNKINKGYIWVCWGDLLFKEYKNGDPFTLSRASDKYYECLSFVEKYEPSQQLLLGRACKSFAEVCFEEKDYERSIYYFEKALRVYKENKDSNFKESVLIPIYKLLGYSFAKYYSEKNSEENNDFLEKALLNYEMSLSLAEKYNLQKQIMFLYELIARVYFEKKDYENSIYYFEKVLKRWEENKKTITLDLKHIQNIEENLEYLRQNNTIIFKDIIAEEEEGFESFDDNNELF